MLPRLSQHLEIDDDSQIGLARRQAVELAERCGLGQVECGNVAIVVTELATNLVKHARGGELIFNSVPALRGQVFEIISVDRGPGMNNVEECLQDGYSSYGSRGNGLGAVQRLSNSLRIFSRPGSGTVVVSRIGPVDSDDRPPIRIGGIAVAAPGEAVCGDAWSVAEQDGKRTIVIADGLGHGDAAAAAAHAAVKVLGEPRLEPGEVLREAHLALRGTRGAAVAVAQLDPQARKLNYCGIGNIAGFIWSAGKTQNMVSHNGIVGAQPPRIREFAYDMPAGAIVVFYSDGLTSHVRLECVADAAGLDPVIVAGALYRDFKRGQDDATAVVAQVD